MIKSIAYTGQDKRLKVIYNYREIAPNMAGVKEQIFAKTRKHSHMIMSVVVQTAVFQSTGILGMCQDARLSDRLSDRLF